MGLHSNLTKILHSDNWKPSPVGPDTQRRAKVLQREMVVQWDDHLTYAYSIFTESELKRAGDCGVYRRNSPLQDQLEQPQVEWQLI